MWPDTTVRYAIRTMSANQYMCITRRRMRSPLNTWYSGMTKPSTFVDSNLRRAQQDEYRCIHLGALSATHDISPSLRAFQSSATPAIQVLCYPFRERVVNMGVNLAKARSGLQILKKPRSLPGALALHLLPVVLRSSLRRIHEPIHTAAGGCQQCSVLTRPRWRRRTTRTWGTIE